MSERGVVMKEIKTTDKHLKRAMKILVLESSGNKNGSSNMLAHEFVRGAKEAGH